MLFNKLLAIAAALTLFMLLTLDEGFAHTHFSAQDATIRSIAFDQHGRMWVATFGRGLWLIDESGIRKFYDETTQLPYPMINNLLFDGQYLWVATAGGGCIKLNTLTDKFEPVGQHAGFEKLHALTRTTTGQIIIGSVGSGTAYLKDNFWQPVKDSQSINLAWVNSVVEWQNRLWLGTSTGLYSASNDLSDWRPQYEKLNRGVNHLAISGDRLLIATTRHGLYSLKASEEPKKAIDFNGMIHFILPGDGFALIIGDKAMWKLTNDETQKLPDSPDLAKCAILDARNRFFIGTTDGKIYLSESGTDFRLKYFFSDNGLEEQK